MKAKLILFLAGVSMLLIPAQLFSQNKYMTTKFQEVTSIPEGKAVIYIYRPGEFTGSAIHYGINANDVPISRVHLYNGGYFAYFVDPGQIILTAEVAKESTTAVVNAEAGQKYFVRGSIRTGTWVGRPYLETVDNAIGIREIVKCKLLVDK